MRRIGSEKEIEYKRKRNMIIISVAMLGLLIFGTVGYAFIASPTTYDQTDPTTTPLSTEPVNLGDRWAVPFEGQTFYLKNSPESTKNISVNTTIILDDYVGKMLYLDSTNTLAEQEIIGVLGRYISRAQKACQGPCEADLPEKDCTENIIVFEENTENKVYQDEKCIFVEGDILTLDAFLYRLMKLN